MAIVAIETLIEIVTSIDSVASLLIVITIDNSSVGTRLAAEQ